MNKKIVLPIVAVIAVLIPILGASMLLSPDADSIGKEFAANNPGAIIGVHTLEANISEREEIQKSEIIIEGTVVDIKPFWKVIRDDINPRIYTEYIVKVNDVIKGDVQAEQTVSVVMAGGYLDGVTTKTESPDIESGDDVIMILGKDISSVWGNSYHPVSVVKSTYILEDNEAKNKMASRTMDKTELKEKLIRLSAD